MSEKSIQQLQAGEAVQNFFLIKTADLKVTNNNKRYLDIMLVDRTGEINAKWWDCTEADAARLQANMLVKVRGVVNEWQGKLQLKIERIRQAQAADGVDFEAFVPVAPLPADMMFDAISQYINAIQQPDIAKIVKTMVGECRPKLMIYPAAKQNHHAVRSGLMYHILTMLQVGEKLCQVYQHLNRDLVYAGVILHDLAKLEEMDAGELGIVSAYTIEGELLGHIIQGIKWIERTGQAVGADPEISMLLQHMVLSHHYEPEYGSPKRPMIPEAELLHYLDIIDARMYDMKKNLEAVAPGGLSEKVWLLHNRKLYKPLAGQEE